MSVNILGNENRVNFIPISSPSPSLISSPSPSLIFPGLDKSWCNICNYRGNITWILALGDIPPPPSLLNSNRELPEGGRGKEGEGEGEVEGVDNTCYSGNEYMYTLLTTQCAFSLIFFIFSLIFFIFLYFLYFFFNFLYFFIFSLYFLYLFFFLSLFFVYLIFIFSLSFLYLSFLYFFFISLLLFLYFFLSVWSCFTFAL